MTFGNGVPWTHYVSDTQLTLDGVRSLGAWFLLLRPRASSVAREGDGARFEDPTGSFDAVLPRSPTGSFVGAESAPAKEQYVFRVVRLPGAQFDFVSIGRNENNDVFLPDASVSRFHAFMRETADGLFVQDVRSGNGTQLAGKRVPRQSDGPPLRVASGDNVRFGDIHGVVYSADALYEAAWSSRK